LFLALKNILSNTLGYALPSRCLSCDETVTTKFSFCPNCWNKLNFITKPFCKICGRSLAFSVLDPCCLKCIQHPPSYDLARAILKFDECSKKLIHNLKYYDKTILAKAFAQTIYNVHKEEIANFDLILPVPMHRLKRMLRFYNQAFLLAKELAIIAQKPICPDVLLKTKWTKPQASLSQKERENNLKNSFTIKNSAQIQGQKVILVDDVLTTGSTAKICAKELKKYASKVFIICVAFT
jgi:ComF family protein